MATFKGTFEEFIDFVGPMTRNIVCNMARSHKKHTTCSHDGCKKRKPLEAAHYKGKDRPKIIADILNNFQSDDNLYSVDLKTFKEKFIMAHTPIHTVILPMCKEHHREYDKVEGIEPEYPIIISEIEKDEDAYTDEELDNLEKSELNMIKEHLKTSLLSTIKSEVCNKYNLLSIQVTFSKISNANGLYNFDIVKKKFEKDFVFIFYNQNEYKVALIKAKTITVSNFPEKDKNTIRFFVDNKYLDKSGFDFTPLFV